MEDRIFSTRLILLISGIGLESSILFAQEGANILLVDVNIEAVQRAEVIVRQRNPDVKALAVRADVGQEADVKAAVDSAIKEFGRLDIMVLYPLLYPQNGSTLALV